MPSNKVRPEHSELFSPSSMQRKILCTASAMLEFESDAPEEPKPAADWGTFAHDIAYTKRTDPDHKQSEFLGSIHANGQTCDQEMLDVVADFLRNQDILKETYLTPDLPFFDEHFEEEVNLSYYGVADMYGTLDHGVTQAFNVLIIHDLKSGAFPVSPEFNTQLMSYAVMYAGDALSTFNKIVLAISQSRGSYGAESLKVWETTPAEILDWLEGTLLPLIKTIRIDKEAKPEDRLTPKPSKEACEFCKAAGNNCEGYIQKNISNMPVTLDNKLVKPKITKDLVNAIYPQLEEVEVFIKRVRSKAATMARDGELTNYKLVAGRNMRKFSDEAGVIEAMLAAGEDPYGDSFPVKTVAQMEKRGTKKDGKLVKIIKPFVSVTQAKSQVVPQSDGRKAIVKEEVPNSF